MTAALVAFVGFVAGAVLGGRLARHLDDDVRGGSPSRSASKWSCW